MTSDLVERLRVAAAASDHPPTLGLLLEAADALANDRASIAAFLEREVVRLTEDLSRMLSPAMASAACARQAERLGAQVGIGQLWAAQIARGDDLQ